MAKRKQSKKYAIQDYLAHYLREAQETQSLRSIAIETTVDVGTLSRFLSGECPLSMVSGEKVFEWFNLKIVERAK